jgi:hypothetical protein
VFDVSNRFDYRGIALEPSLDVAGGPRLQHRRSPGPADRRRAPGRHVLRRFTRLRHQHAAGPRGPGRAGGHGARPPSSFSRCLGRRWAASGFAQSTCAAPPPRAARRPAKTRGTAMGLGVTWTFARFDRPEET